MLLGMGWKGALRSYGAYQRAQLRSERREMREAQRAAREQLAQQKQELVEQLVERYEMQLRLLSTVHHDCGPTIDWQEVAREPAPPKPTPIARRTDAALAAIAEYSPGVFASIFGGAKKKRAAFAQQLEDAMLVDAADSRDAITLHAVTCRDHEEARAVANAVLRGEVARFLEALDGVDAFDELEEVAMSVTATTPRADIVLVEIVLPASDVVVPDEQHSVTQRGKLSSKAMPKTRKNEIYQDYVCGAALRACREVFAALPVGWVCATVSTKVLNQATGHIENAPVLSVMAPRRTAQQLKYDSLDPSEAMTNFLHRMGFKKSTGISAIVALTVDDVPTG